MQELDDAKEVNNISIRKPNLSSVVLDLSRMLILPSRPVLRLRMETRSPMYVLWIQEQFLRCGMA